MAHMPSRYNDSFDSSNQWQGSCPCSGSLTSSCSQCPSSLRLAEPIQSVPMRKSVDYKLKRTSMLGSSLNNFTAGLCVAQEVIRIETQSVIVLLAKLMQKLHNTFNWADFSGRKPSPKEQRSAACSQSNGYQKIKSIQLRNDSQSTKPNTNVQQTFIYMFYDIKVRSCMAHMPSRYNDLFDSSNQWQGSCPCSGSLTSSCFQCPSSLHLPEPIQSVPMRKSVDYKLKRTSMLGSSLNNFTAGLCVAQDETRSFIVLIAEKCRNCTIVFTGLKHNTCVSLKIFNIF